MELKISHNEKGIIVHDGDQEFVFVDLNNRFNLPGIQDFLAAHTMLLGKNLTEKEIVFDEKFPEAEKAGFTIFLNDLLGKVNVEVFK